MTMIYKVVWLDYGKSWFEARLTGNETSEKYHHDAEVQRLVAEERAAAFKAAAEICDEERHNLNVLTSMPPQSAGVVAARNRILSALSDAPPRKVTPQEAAKVLLEQWDDHGEGPLGDLCCYALFHRDGEPSKLEPWVDGGFVKIDDLEDALRALADEGDNGGKA